MRESGILMHLSSLPGPYGIGTMGKQAYDFVDFLKAAGQSCWQILPLSPTGYGDSPYQSCSTFAGNPYLVDLDMLVEEGLLKTADLDGIAWCESETKVNYGTQYNQRWSILRLAYSRFTGSDAFDTFCRDNSSWLGDFTLFLALKAKHSNLVWNQWPEKLKHRDADAIWQARQELKDEIRFYSFVQFLFFTQWNALRAYAKESNITIIGDVPIYVPLDSADVWSNPELFQLDEDLNPTAVAGCPPDAFSEDGQLWGNPLYRWELMKETGFAWWMNRLSAAGQLYDVVRLDHFRGFEAY
jgi:4-alpha-glucanotransferase